MLDIPAGSRRTPIYGFYVLVFAFRQPFHFHVMFYMSSVCLPVLYVNWQTKTPCVAFIYVLIYTYVMWRQVLYGYTIHDIYYDMNCVYMFIYQ